MAAVMCFQRMKRKLINIQMRFILNYMQKQCERVLAVTDTYAYVCMVALPGTRVYSLVCVCHIAEPIKAAFGQFSTYLSSNPLTLLNFYFESRLHSLLMTSECNWASKVNAGLNHKDVCVYDFI